MILYAIYMNKGKANVAADQELPQVTEAAKSGVLGGGPDQIHPVDIEPVLGLGSAGESQKKTEPGGARAASNEPPRKVGDQLV